ncbi:MAG: ABC transporter ATP-binding protein, partial [Ardenticatenales bacterium]|nr:ABC transporter ATP-binding protein [Ardenticatenales bacterium]
MLRVTDLTYRYPDTDTAALHDITFSLAAGDLLLLAGANGSGKSTLCYALGGFAPHFFNGEITGDVTLGELSMRATPLGEWVQQVGLVLQNPFNQLSGARLTVFEEVAFGLENLGVSRAEMGERVRAILQQLEISELAERSPYALSGGQMQRVAIASILVLRPRLLVLDEPTAQLDPQGSTDLFALLQALAGQGSTIVLATHDLAQAAPFASTTLVLHRGRIALHGKTSTVLDDPRLAAWGVEPPLYTTLAAGAGVGAG